MDSKPKNKKYRMVRLYDETVTRAKAIGKPKNICAARVIDHICAQGLKELEEGGASLETVFKLKP